MLLEVKKNTEGKVNRMPDPISYLHLLERGKEINALLELESLDEEDRSNQINSKIAECFFNRQDIESFSQHFKDTIKREKQRKEPLVSRLKCQR